MKYSKYKTAHMCAALCVIKGTAKRTQTACGWEATQANKEPMRSRPAGAGQGVLGEGGASRKRRRGGGSAPLGTLSEQLVFGSRFMLDTFKAPQLMGRERGQ